MDWADKLAKEMLDNLSTCISDKEKLLLLAAYLRNERSRGMLVAVEEYSKMLKKCQ